ncbi:spermatogenesis-associated protein 16-like isoform X2 [Trachinotus anak]|uniref:spermatogenesis-associated protein 16-like isoform X2 n=1 Tax=Trachinotus anak TaxID=443729 RepID=UPI0039F24FE4
MRCSKSTADPKRDQRPRSCRTSLTSRPAVSTGQEVKRLKRWSDISQDRKDVKKKEEKDTGDKGEKQTDRIPWRRNLTPPPHQLISSRRLLNLENSLALGIEMLPAFDNSSSSFSSSASLQTYLPSHTVSFSSSLSGHQDHRSKEIRHGPNLSFLPPVDKELFALLTDANLYCSMKKYATAVKSLCTALQLTSKGHVLNDAMMHCGSPADIDLVFSYIQAKLVICYLRMKKPQLALIHAHRSIQLNPSHFQNHLRQAVVYRKLGKPCKAAKSVLTADWLYCLLGGTERHISTQLKLYWQAMLYEAQLMEDISVIYTLYHGDPTAEDISQAKEASMMQHPAFTGFIYTDPRGGHVLPQTTDWLSAAAEPLHYLITLGFRRREDGLFLKKMYSRIWPSLPDTDIKGTLHSPKQQQMEEVKTQKICDMYEKILPVLDLIQATQINSGVCVGSGLIEWLQYGSLLLKLGYHREHNTILHCCQAQLTTAPYLPQISTQQENTPLLQALLTDIMDELGRERTSTERVWSKMLKVGWLEDRIHSVEKKYRLMKAGSHRCRQIHKDKAKVRKRSNIYRELFPTLTNEHKVAKQISPSHENPTPVGMKTP